MEQKIDAQKKKYDFTIAHLGDPKISSPIKMSIDADDGLADYVDDHQRIYYGIDAIINDDGEEVPQYHDTVEVAGPREKIYFNPAHVHAAIATCGGICPGLNNVIRAVVRCFWYRYNVRRISGIRFGYRGLLRESPYPLIALDPDVVDEIQEKGGTILGSSRGGGDKVEEIVDSLERLNVNVLITIGGDGTLRGAWEIGEEIRKRNLKIAVIGVPKTIDNDLSFIQVSFGFDTAVTMAVPSVRGAHNEAKGSINGIGLVKVMGRESGFIAAHTALAQSDVNFCLIPENPFDLDGPNGLLSHLKKRILDRGHAIILVAEGAGQHLIHNTGEKDPSGNKKFNDIGVFLKDEISKFFKKEGIEVNMKYIDPSYIIRSAAANSNDSIYCSRLGAHAVHAAMSGKTQALISLVNNRFVHIPIKVAVAERNHVDVEGILWRDVLENTRQPASMKN
ncbi:MAG: ATP-dependent 6-phosphofructokinase [Sphaerochaetaceae bacterium]|jgi:6-phosphofructokinase 1|nr:ATP-dependent 6-phosphofructokinase [Sphaerochaetaceae bacterium]NLO60050.1 ATP-dependent 6-phosphofructokinase [Spirochaetales bacterium]MDD3670703.1 ATP-dependent 6-phosphofructokinase [Sphaerochaetaceae bacterium]MDD4258496.1 ATP-dependent 6-phosphofructokinase [Sphaerochaetaceae bacterium]MDD4762347.1 ATP-dependent 6-phosphofructokinase [Sphaerochaetaceae bacterium]